MASQRPVPLRGSPPRLWTHANNISGKIALRFPLQTLSLDDVAAKQTDIVHPAAPIRPAPARQFDEHSPSSRRRRSLFASTAAYFPLRQSVWDCLTRKLGAACQRLFAFHGHQAQRSMRGCLPTFPLGPLMCPVLGCPRIEHRGTRRCPGSRGRAEWKSRLSIAGKLVFGSSLQRRFSRFTPAASTGRELVWQAGMIGSKRRQACGSRWRRGHTHGPANRRFSPSRGGWFRDRWLRRCCWGRRNWRSRRHERSGYSSQ